MVSDLMVPAKRVSRTGLVAVWSDSVAILGRNLRRYQRQPQIAVFVLVQPVMFVVLFRYVFAGSIPTPGLDYMQYLMPGIIVQSVTFACVGTAVSIAEDLRAGMLDRFRSLPMARSAVLAGRVLSDVLVSLVTLTTMMVVAYLVGFRITTSAAAALAALGLLVVFVASFAWIAAWIGLSLKAPEAVQSAGFLWLFPLAFASSLFVFPATMPSWLQIVAQWNPLSSVANAARALTVGGYPCGRSLDDIEMCTRWAGDVVASLGWALLILLVFVPLSVRGWRKLD